MKIKTLSRSGHDPPGAQKSSQNLDTSLHPFSRGREYIRALNASKLERMFASPFIRQIGNGYVDGVYCLATEPESLKYFASGSGDGVIKIWDYDKELWQTKGHSHMVKGVCWARDQKLLSCSNDK